MKASELIRVLMSIPANAEIRIGDQVESGPYLHASVGGVFWGFNGDVILCANDDEVWKPETPDATDEEVGKLWSPKT